MKKFLALISALVMAFSLVACGGESNISSNNGNQNDSESVKIGVLIPGSPTNGGFCQQGANGAELLRTKGYDVSLVEAVTAEEIKSEAENMANDGYKIVIGHGGQCDTPFAEISPDYPETWFIVTGGSIVTENQFSFYMSGAEECMYVIGLVAGMMTKTNTIAYTLDGDFPAYTVHTNAFQLGAETANPNVKTLAALLSTATSTEGYETTLNQISAGADMLYSNTNEAQAGAMKAAEENDGVYIFGNVDDFSSVAPSSCLCSLVTNYPAGFEKAVDAVMSGDFEPQILFVNMADGAATICWNEALKSTVPAEVLEAADHACQDIMDGKIKVPSAYDLGPDYKIGGEVVR